MGIPNYTSDHRQFFLYRVEPATGCSDIRDHVADLQLDVQLDDVKCVSNKNAKFKSFVLTCNVKDYYALMDGNCWPTGTYVRRYRDKTQKPNRNVQSESSDCNDENTIAKHF